MKDIIVKTSTIRELCQASIARINEYAERIETVEKVRKKEIEEHKDPEWSAAIELYQMKDRNLFYCPDFPLFRTMRHHRYCTSFLKRLRDSLEKQEEMCFTGEEFLSMHPEDYSRLLRKGEIQVEELEYWLNLRLEDFSHFHRKELEDWKKLEEEREAMKEKYRQERKQERIKREEAEKAYRTPARSKVMKPTPAEIEPVPLPSPWWIMVGALVFVAALVAGSMA